MNRKKKWITLGILEAAAALLIAGYCILCQTTEDSRIWGSPSINGVSVGGLTREEAETAVLDRFEKDYRNACITAVLDGQEFQIPVYSLLDIDPREAVDQAYETGHGSWFARGAEWIGCHLGLLGSPDLTAEPFVKYPENLDQAMEDSGILEYNSRSESTYELSGSVLTIHKGRGGVTADEDRLRDVLLESLEKGDLTGTVSCPVLDSEAEGLDLQAVAAEVQQEPVNATLNPADNYSVVPAVPGLTLDIEEAQEAYDKAAPGSEAVILLDTVAPEISTEDLEANLFQDVLGSYQSTASGNGGREHNIALAVSMCDGIIVMPGEIFSYNGIIGETSVEQGFAYANAYSEGSVVQEPGGGVCQVSSTMFSALLQTDIEIVQRRYHSMIVTYVPYGMDATVSWDQPDFRFKNNHSYPIKLSMSFEAGVLTVEILGTVESDLTVECRVEQTGELEFVTYRDYYDSSGSLVNSEYITTSKYKPVS